LITRLMAMLTIFVVSVGKKLSGSLPSEQETRSAPQVRWSKKGLHPLTQRVVSSPISADWKNLAAQRSSNSEVSP